MKKQLPRIQRDEKQLGLFVRVWDEILKEHKITRHQTRILFQLDLLSFDPDVQEHLAENQLDELLFTKTLLIDSGSSTEQCCCHVKPTSTAVLL